MNKLLIKFNSEYHYLFSIINDFSNNPSPEFYYLYNLPNILRKYIEAFLGFKIPKCEGLKKKITYLITEPILKDKVYKFINQYSHNTTLTCSLNFPDLSECSEIVKIVMEKVKQMDEQHYNALIETVNEFKEN